METLIIRHTPVATDRTPCGTRIVSLLLPAVASALTLLNPVAAQKTPGGPPIDLTAPEPSNQQGLGVPGASGGTFQPPRYELPLRAEIINTSVGKDGDFILEVQLENSGQQPFDLPISRNISDVQRTAGKFRREFLLRIQPVSTESVEAVGSVVTAGSTAVPGSFMHLDPGHSVRVLLRAESNRVKRAMPSKAKELDVRIVCGEWTLDDNRFSIRTMARDLPSINTTALGFGTER